MLKAERENLKVKKITQMDKRMTTKTYKIWSPIVWSGLSDPWSISHTIQAYKLGHIKNYKAKPYS